MYMVSCDCTSDVTEWSCPATVVSQVEPRLAGGNAERDTREQESLEHFRAATNRLFLAAGGFKRGSAIDAVKEGKADAVVFGEANSLRPHGMLRFRVVLNQ